MNKPLREACWTGRLDDPKFIFFFSVSLCLCGENPYSLPYTNAAALVDVHTALN